MKSLTLTIVIPAYNEENHIKDCLDSIADLSEPPDEVILVDNNSTDRTLEIAKGYDFVKVIREKRQGVLHARTAGFNEAKSDIIGRIDSETHLPPNWVTTVKRIFSNQNIDAATGPVGYHDVPYVKTGLFFDNKIRKAVWDIGAKDDALFLYGGNMAFRSKAWEKVKNNLCVRNDIHEDIDLAIHLSEMGMMIHYDTKLIAYISARRMNDSATEFYKYLRVNHRTYEAHDIQTPADDFMVAIVLASKFGVNLIQRAYDKQTKQLSLKKFITGSKDLEIRESPVKLD